MVVLKEPKKIRMYIDEAGFTITSLADKVGYSKAYISSILCGTRNPNAKVSIKICEHLNKKFDDIFYIQNVHNKITKNGDLTQR